MSSLDVGLSMIRTVSRRVVAFHDQAWRRFNDFMPKGLYARSLLIMIVPMVVLQSVVAFVFMERHWNTVTRRLSSAVVQDIAALIDVYKGYPQDKDRSQLRRIAQERLGLVVDFLGPDDMPPPGPKPFFSLLDQSISRQLSRRVARPFWIDTVGRSNLVEIRIQLDDAVMRVFAQRSAAYASNSEIFLFWMLGTSTLLLVVAVLFLRNQIRPILRLADAAESFGKGREVPNCLPRGESRVERAMEQRTAMLAGVSHDLRTILTRFKLELALLGDSPETEAMRKDVDEMAWMLEDYLAFARGDSGEQAQRPTWRRRWNDRHGGGVGRIAQRCRTARPRRHRPVSWRAGGDGQARGVQALPGQSGVECRALCRQHRDHRPPRPSLSDGHGR